MKRLCFFLLFLSFVANGQDAINWVNVIQKVKPSVVGIGLHTPMNAPSNQLQGTGFVIGNGKYVATNYHVIAEPLDPEIVQYRAVFVGNAKNTRTLRAEVVGIDPVHDLAILKVEDVLTPLKVGTDEYVPEGTIIGFTGYPIGAVLGLYPATHRGMVAAVTPDAMPAYNSTQLSINMLDRLKQTFMIYQLDATAYPGNSGSAMYRASDGVVIGVMNKVFVAEGKENALSKPSGISYAIPAVHLRELAAKYNIDI